MQHLDPTAVADRDDPTVRTTRQGLVGLNVEHQRAVLASHDSQDVDALDTEQLIGPGAPRHARTTRTVGHARSSGMGCLVAPDP